MSRLPSDLINDIGVHLVWFMVVAAWVAMFGLMCFGLVEFVSWAGHLLLSGLP